MVKCKLCKSGETKFFHQKNLYKYYTCKSCRTLFLHPLPSPKKIKDYYRKSFKYTAGETNEKQIRTRAKIIIKNLKRLNPTGKSLLDIGSGYGYFIDEAAKNGYNVVGIEPSKSLSATLINHLIKVKLHNVDYEAYFEKNQNKKFDFITIIHTIEHVINPQEFINKALKHLNTRGILYIETPNLDSHLFRAEKQNYTFLTPPDHIWIFSRKSFATILQHFQKIKIKKFSSYSSPEHLMGIIKSLINQKRSENRKIRNQNNSDKSDISDLSYIRLNQPLRSLPDYSEKAFKLIKYIILDKTLSPILTPILDLGIYGSILELYIKKK